MVSKYLKINIYTRIVGFIIDLVFLLFSTIEQQQVFYTQTWVLLILGSVFGTFLNASLISGKVNTLIFSIFYLVLGIVSLFVFTNKVYLIFFLMASFVIYLINRKIITNDQIIRNSLVQSIQNTILLIATILFVFELVDFDDLVLVIFVIMSIRTAAFYFICIDCCLNQNLEVLSIRTVSQILTVIRPIVLNSFRFFVPESQMGLVTVIGKIINALYIFLVTPLILRKDYNHLFVFWTLMIFLVVLAFAFLQTSATIMLLFIILILSEIIYIKIHQK